MRLPRILFLACPILLAACTSGEMKSTLGLNRTAPDEFSVVSRPPLSVPPEFELKPPHPGEGGPQQPSATEQAHQVLTGKETPPASLEDLPSLPASPTAVAPVITSDAPDAPTSNFLAHLGADKADPAIRDKLTEDAATPHGAPAKSLYEKVVGGKTSPEPVVDPAKESDRLRTNKDEGKPVNEGDVPTEQEKPKSVIDEVF